MYKIIKKQELSPGVKLFDVLAPRIEKKALQKLKDYLKVSAI